MAVCDSDGDGTLNITEFERSLKVVEMRRAFMAIDKDGSGQINISELHELAAAVHMTEDEVARRSFTGRSRTLNVAACHR